MQSFAGRTAPGHGARRGLIAAALVLCCGVTTTSRAHEGPPFPIVMEEPVGPHVVSIWTDPDIGTGTFFVVFEPSAASEPASIREVLIAVQPVDDRLPEVTVAAEAQPVRHGARWYAEVEFDRGGLWDVRVLIRGVREHWEIPSRVEATPDGVIGPIGLLVYLLPFLAVGFLWWKAATKRRQFRPRVQEVVR